jgi:hypothetical protein
MFMEHYAVGFAAKKVFPKTSLGAYFLTAEWLDVLWPIFLLLGFEHVRVAPGIIRLMPLDLYDMPYSHSLLAALFWSLAWSGGFFLWRRSLRGAMTIGFCVLSHWFLDALVHRPDLPLGFSDTHFIGFGLWGSPIATLVVEGGLFVYGLRLYLSSTRPLDSIGSYGLWGFVAVLLLVFSGQFLQITPPNVTSVAFAGNGIWILILAGYWVDRHRTPVKL